MEAAPTTRVDVGKVLRETFSIYGSYAAILLGTALVVFVAVGIINALLTSADGVVMSLLGSIVSLVGTTLYTGFVVTLVHDVRDGRRDFTIGQLLSSAAGAIVRLIANGIVKAIAVIIGLILLVVPGLILLTIWAVTAPAIVVERAGAIEAFGRSRQLVRGEGWSVFAVIVIAFLIAVVIGILFGAIGTPLGDAAQGIFSTIGQVIAAPISALVASVLFFDLGGGQAAPTAPGAGPPATPTESPEPPA